MTSKQHREIVFNKYGGKCAYCGTDLQKGWHIDEKEPVRRNYKYQDAYWINENTKIRRTIKEMNKISEEDCKGWKYVERKLITDGCMHPERFNIDNQMPACPSCNINKHSGSIEEFRGLIQGFINSLNRDSTQYKIAKRYGLVQEIEKPVIFYFETINNKKHGT